MDAVLLKLMLTCFLYAVSTNILAIVVSFPKKLSIFMNASCALAYVAGWAFTIGYTVHWIWK